MDQGEGTIEVLAANGFEPSTRDLHVLLRHRPPSIPPRPGRGLPAAARPLQIIAERRRCGHWLPTRRCDECRPPWRCGFLVSVSSTAALTLQGRGHRPRRAARPGSWFPQVRRVGQRRDGDALDGLAVMGVNTLAQRVTFGLDLAKLTTPRRRLMTKLAHVALAVQVELGVRRLRCGIALREQRPPEARRRGWCRSSWPPGRSWPRQGRCLQGEIATKERRPASRARCLGGCAIGGSPLGWLVSHPTFSIDRSSRRARRRIIPP